MTRARKPAALLARRERHADKCRRSQRQHAQHLAYEASRPDNGPRPRSAGHGKAARRGRVRNGARALARVLARSTGRVAKAKWA